jgi:hypothetical protein
MRRSQLINENFMVRGCSIHSMCNLCNYHVETSFQNLVLANFPYEPNLAHQKNWKNIWIESDSALVVLAFENHEMHHVTWSLRNKWLNVQFLLRQMHCIVTHI